MSFIIAKNIDGFTHILADTCFTYEDTVKEPSPWQMPYIGLKTILLSPCTCVSFAGEDISYAKAAFTEFYTKDLDLFDLSGIISHFESYHIKSGNKVDFLISTVIYPKTQILKISDLKIIDSGSSAWLGDDRGFKEFQKHFLLPEPENTRGDIWITVNGQRVEPKTTQISRMIDGFSAVLKAPAIETINGFPIHISSNKDGFFVSESFSIVSGDKIRFASADPTAIYFGDVTTGAYSFHILGSHYAGNGVVGVYIQEASLGILYNPRNSLDGLFFPKMSKEEFQKRHRQECDDLQALAMRNQAKYHPGVL